MATRIRGSEPINGATIAISGALGSTAGDKLTYTCPAGRQAKLTFAAWYNATNAPNVLSILTIGGQGTLMSSGTAPFTHSGGALLNAGDSFVFHVTTVVATSSFDACICAEEYPVS